MKQKLAFLCGFCVRANAAIKQNLQRYFPDDRDSGGGTQGGGWGTRESDYRSDKACLLCSQRMCVKMSE